MMRLCYALRAGTRKYWESDSRMPCFLQPTWTPLRLLSAPSQPLPPCQVLQEHNLARLRGRWDGMHRVCRASPPKRWRTSKASHMSTATGTWPVC